MATLFPPIQSPISTPLMGDGAPPGYGRSTTPDGTPFTFNGQPVFDNGNQLNLSVIAL